MPTVCSRAARDRPGGPTSTTSPHTPRAARPPTRTSRPCVGHIPAQDPRRLDLHDHRARPPPVAHPDGPTRPGHRGRDDVPRPHRAPTPLTAPPPADGLRRAGYSDAATPLV